MGGKGANQAVAVVRFGCRAALIARVGADARGEKALDRLAAEGVDVHHVLRDDKEPTGAALILVNHSGEKQIFAALGANRRVTEADVDAAKTTITSAKVLLAQLEVPVPSVVLALRLARAAGVRTVLDPAPAVPLADDILQLVDVIRPNASEAEVLTGVSVHNRRSAARAARVLLRRGVRAVVVQAGEQGDLLITPDEEQFLPRLPVDSVDATGAGDAFAAVLAASLAEGRPLTAAAVLANVAAALATTKLGAQAGLPRREDVLRFLAESQTSSAHREKRSSILGEMTTADQEKMTMNTGMGEFGPGAIFLAGVGVGAGLMCMYDPDRGARRRGLARDKARHIMREGSHVTGKAVRDLENRAGGLMARARVGLAARDVPDDATLVERIRAQMGRWVSNPGSIEVLAQDGRVVLSGPIFRSEFDALVRRVHRVHGVRAVENRLEVHEASARVPGLQREPRPGPRSTWLSENWPPSARLLAACAGTAGGAYGIRHGGLFGNVLAGASAVVLIRAITNLPVRQITGIGAGRRAIDLRKTMIIDAPVAEVFEFWTRFENFPSFMEHVREVKVSADGWHTHWIVEGPGGTTLAWDADVTALEPNEVLAWKTLPGASVEHAGIIRFEAVDENHTRLDIQMSYNPPAGAMGHVLARLFRKDPKTAMNEDLLRLKSLLEGHGIPRPLQRTQVVATSPGQS